MLYTTLGFRIFWLKDAGLQRDCFRVYNDWLAEYCSYAPTRMAGLALISLYDPQAGRRGARALRQAGAQGRDDLVLAAAGQPYSSDIYDPFWATAQEMHMPISLHAITGMGLESQWDFGERYMRATVLPARGRALVQRADLLRRARPLPAAADRLGGEQLRLDALLPAAHGPRLRAQPRASGFNSA